MDCKSIYLTVRAKVDDGYFKTGEIYKAKNKCVFSGVTLDNASNNLRFEIDLKDRNIVDNISRVLSVDLSKKYLIRDFEVLTETYGEDELGTIRI